MLPPDRSMNIKDEKCSAHCAQLIADLQKGAHDGRGPLLYCNALRPVGVTILGDTIKE